MKWVVLAVRILVGLPFFVFGLQHFVPFLPMPTPQLPENATMFVTALMASHYMDIVKALEVVGGALLLSGRLVPLGLVLLTPVAVNIALFDILLMGQPALGVILTLLCFFLIWAYRLHFAPVFALNPKIG